MTSPAENPLQNPEPPQKPSADSAGAAAMARLFAFGITVVLLMVAAIVTGDIYYG